MKFICPSGFVIPGSPKDGSLDSVTVEMISKTLMNRVSMEGAFVTMEMASRRLLSFAACFRELCGLCWMLHVRDQLSVSCRKYQAARNHGTGTQVCCDQEEA